MARERLQKILARAGVASRRAAETLIEAGRVKVAGRVVTELGVRADPEKDRVEVDGRRVMAEPLLYLVLHKPRGVVSTMRDPEGRPTVAELVRGAGARVVPVGRLDFNTSGVLLMTNDGEFAVGLSHPRRAVAKVYVAKVNGVVDDDNLEQWTRSIVIDGRPTVPAEVKRLRVVGGKTWLEVRLREGRNRQVRRLGDATGRAVMRLARVEYAGISAEGLRPGEWRHLTVEELSQMKKTFGVPRRVHAPAFSGRTPRTKSRRAVSASSVVRPGGGRKADRRGPPRRP